jgi:hypothetical protein
LSIRSHIARRANGSTPERNRKYLWFSLFRLI